MKYEKFPFKIEKQFRLKGWDYSQNGYYFVTICTKDRLQILGSVGTDHCVCSSLFGRSCNRIWLTIPKKFRNVILDDYVFMPDHIHGIIVINNYQAQINDKQERVDCRQERTQWSVPTQFGNIGLLSQAIRWFKTISTNEYINLIKQNKEERFLKRIWQPRFHDRIIRNEKEYFAIKQYIKDNLKNWGKENG